MAQQQVANDMQHFRDEFKVAVANKDRAQIYNTDQSGFNLELLSQRTLEVRGTKQVISTIRSKPSGTHSYTVIGDTSSLWNVLALNKYLNEPSHPSDKFWRALANEMTIDQELLFVARSIHMNQ